MEEIVHKNTFGKVFDETHPIPANGTANAAETGEASQDADKTDQSTESAERQAPDTPVTEAPIRKRGRKKKDAGDGDSDTVEKPYRFFCYCDKILIDQVRAIARKENMTIRAVVEKMLSKCIGKYEKKFGDIPVKEKSHSPDELF